MKPGPAPKPLALKIAEGNPGKHPLNYDAPSAPEGEPDQPSGMTPEAKREWSPIIAEITKMPGVLQTSDGYALANLCEVRAGRLRLQRALERRVRDAKSAITQELATANSALKDGEKPVKKSKRDIEDEAYERATTELAGGRLCQHPVLRSLNEARKQEQNLYRSFGLDPSGRSSLKIPAAAKEKSDPLDAIYSASGPKLVKNVI